MKEYVKIVQIKKLKMKLTFSLDVQNLGGREMFFSLPYQLKLKNFTNLSDKNKLFRLLNCENQEILNSVEYPQRTCLYLWIVRFKKKKQI